MTEPTKQRYWTFPAKLITDFSTFTFLIWLGFAAAIGMLTITLDRYSTLDQSLWEQASQVPPWFVLSIGVHLGSHLLPLNVAHGKTRRDFAIEASMFMVLYSAVVALMVTVGWVIERIQYDVMDLSQSLDQDHLYASATSYPAIFLETWLLLMIWTAGGFFIAASWYRFDNEGLLAIIPALFIASITDLGMGGSWGPLDDVLKRIYDPSNPPVLVSVIIAIAGFAALLAMSWPIVRELPMRKTPA